ncbi:hypothetical protein EON64_19840 [archaeon]|nr:MAG: hypothetical protein EON64_19840 [archaeon]
MTSFASFRLIRLNASQLPRQCVRVSASRRLFSQTSLRSSGPSNPLPIVAIIAALGGTAYYFYYNRQARDKPSPIVEAFERGDIPEEFGSDLPLDPTSPNHDKYFPPYPPYTPRPEIESQITRVIQSDDSTHFSVITGPECVGKGQLIRQVVRTLPQPRGVLYTHIPPVSTLHGYGLRLARRIKSKHSGRMDVRWREVAYELEQAALDYKIRHQRPMVLVIDKVRVLVIECMKLLLRVHVHNQGRL